MWDLKADINDLDDAIRIAPPAIFAEIQAELSSLDDDEDDDDDENDDENDDEDDEYDEYDER